MTPWDENDTRTEWDWLSDMAALGVVIFVTAIASIGLLIFGYWVFK